MKPTIGRIVIYRHLGEVVTLSPAIIQKVNADESVDLVVFGAVYPMKMDGIQQGEGVNRWKWPPAPEKALAPQPQPTPVSQPAVPKQAPRKRVAKAAKKS